VTAALRHITRRSELTHEHPILSSNDANVLDVAIAQGPLSTSVLVCQQTNYEIMADKSK